MYICIFLWKVLKQLQNSWPHRASMCKLVRSFWRTRHNVSLKWYVIEWPCTGHFQKYHNTLCLSSKIFHKHCFYFLLGLTIVSWEKKQCLCKILEDKQRVLWYFWKWPIAVFWCEAKVFKASIITCCPRTSGFPSVYFKMSSFLLFRQ